MLAGDLGAVAEVALTAGEEAVLADRARAAAGGAADAGLDQRLASRRPWPRSGTASVEWKLDGARIQVHRSGDEVRIYTRNLNDVTARLPEVVDVVAGFDAAVVRARRRGARLHGAEDQRRRRSRTR